MPTFQLTLKGYNPDNSNTDHLIKWIVAKNLETLNKFIESNKLELAEPPEQLGYHADNYNKEDGVDMFLP